MNRVSRTDVLMSVVLAGAFTATLTIGSFALAPASQAGCESQTPAEVTGDAGSTGSVITVSVTVPTEGSQTCADASSTLPAGKWLTRPVCELGGTATCKETDRCDDGSVKHTAWYQTDDGQKMFIQTVCPDKNPKPTPGEVFTAFKDYPLPESVIAIQPPGGETLVNLATILSTTAGPFVSAPIKLRGQTVILHIQPAQFVWHHGDGTKQTTTEPGKKWEENDDPEALINHVYDLKAEDLKVSVDTTWSATWTLNGVDQGAVSGTVTKVGEAQELDVLEARPTLVN